VNAAEVEEMDGFESCNPIVELLSRDAPFVFLEPIGERPYAEGDSAGGIDLQRRSWASAEADAALQRDHAQVFLSQPRYEDDCDQWQNCGLGNTHGDSLVGRKRPGKR
jgi:hypothetical protein